MDRTFEPPGPTGARGIGLLYSPFGELAQALFLNDLNFQMHIALARIHARRNGILSRAGDDRPEGIIGEGSGG